MLGRSKLAVTRVGAGPADPTGVVPFPRAEMDPRELAAAFDRYRTEAAHAQPGAPSSIALAEARVNLTRLLIRDGWEPPASVLEQIGKDEELLRHRLTSVS
jgi:hypothetical protein